MGSEDAKEKIEKVWKRCKFQKYCKDLPGPKREWKIQDVVNAIEKDHELTKNGVTGTLNKTELWIKSKNRKSTVFVLERSSHALKWYTGKIKTGSFGGNQVAWYKWFKDETPNVENSIVAEGIVCTIHHLDGKYTMEYRSIWLTLEDNGLFKLRFNLEPKPKSKNLFQKLIYIFFRGHSRT